MASTARWVNPPETFVHHSRGPGRPVDEYWSGIDARLAASPAVESPFVRAVASGVASPERVRSFASDLLVLARELPLIEGEIASRAALHGVDTVILLAYGATLAFGYNGYEPLVDSVARFDSAVSGSSATGQGEPSIATTAFLVCVRSLGLEWFEAGVAATMVDEQWHDAAVALQRGFTDHYGLGAREISCFEALAAFDGPRRSARPSLLRELAVTGYHQYVIDHAVRESVAVWTNMWSSW